MADKNKKKKDERSGESRNGGVIAPATVVGSAKASPSVPKAAVVVPASGQHVVLPDVASQAISSVDSQINSLGVPYESETFKPLDASQPSVKPFSIADAVFGPEQSADASVSAADVRDQRFQDWLNARRQAVEQQRTDDVRMARLNAIGNVLTTMVQPLGWAIGGQGKATGGVQPIDNRQYLQAFERAMKANDDLRNIGTLEGEYQFKLAEDAYRREQAMADYEQKARMQAQIQQDYAQARHDYTMAEIAARGEAQKELARFKAGNSITHRNGVPVEEKMLSAAWIRYMSEREKYNTDVDRGIVRKRESFPSFEKWLGDEDYGWIVKSKKGGSDAKPQGGDDFSKYKRNGSGTSASANAAASGEDFSQYKRN